MSILLSIVFANLLVSGVSLIGAVFLLVRGNLAERISPLLVALASGSLIGAAFFHLIPESLEPAQRSFLWVVGGIMAFLALEKFLCWRHCHEERCELHAFVYLNLVGDGVHNFLDGVIIAGSFLVSPKLGLITTGVVLLHEVPQELGDFGVMIYGGLSRSRALVYNLISALFSVLGGAFAYTFSRYVQDLHGALLPFAAGGFLYIALVDLIPELHKRRAPGEGWLQFGLIWLGLVVLWAATLA